MPKVIIAKAVDGNGVTLSGQSLNDLLTAGSGDQILYGTAGNDTLVGGLGNQQLYGGSDHDSIIGGTGSQTLSGGAGNDILIGGTGAQQLLGGSDNDTIVAGYGAQVLDGGQGFDTVDFSKLHGKLDLDLDLYFATFTDAATGAVTTYGVKSFDTVVGTNEGTIFEGAQSTPRAYIGGAGNDRFQSESGGDTVISGAGADTFRWFKIYVAVNHADEVKDFQVGTDKLDMGDFLKGQHTVDGTYMKLPAMEQVVHLVAASDAAGHASTLVQALTGTGIWHDVVLLDGVDVNTVTVADLVL
jgi:Ca2+-binding RTX toxin-like protein